jgi:histidinol-phosphate aminotransferase
MVSAARGAGLVYFCNPNNPTATVHGKTAVTGYIDQVGRVSPETTVLVDEAYHEYVEDPSYGTVIPIGGIGTRRRRSADVSKGSPAASARATRSANRTRSRRCRRGSSGQASTSSRSRRRGDGHDAAHIARAAAESRSRAFTRKFFENAGYTVHAAEANFMMIDIHRDAKAFKLACVKQHVAIGRAFPALPTFARVSVGTLPEMKKAVAVFRTVLATAVSSSH